MEIKLLANVYGTGRTWCNKPTCYEAGEILKVEPADNLPAESQIKFWVVQDGWQDDKYGFPIWQTDKFKILESESEK